MSTDNKIITGGGIMASTTDTPGDVRTRVETFDDIANIDNPFRGMEVYVADEGKEYRITKLVPKIIGGVEIPNGAIDLSDPEAVIDVKEDIVQEAATAAAETVKQTMKVEGDTLYL